MARGRRNGVLIAGGGVAGCLAALAIARHRPDVPLLIVEERETFGGAGFHHYFEDELEDGARGLVDSLASARWPGFYVAFDDFSRKLKAACGGLDSRALHDAMIETLAPGQYRLGTKVVAVRDDALVLDGGEEVRAEGAIDARGAANLSQLDLGYEARLDHYLLLRGWRTVEVEGRCALARPLPVGGDFQAFWRIGGARVAKLGLRGGFVHPATGRTAGDAVRNALLLAEQRDFSGAALHDLFEEQARSLWRRREPLRAVNAAIAATAPQDRRALMERLYALDAGTVLRFETDRLGLLDRRRVQKALRG